MGKAIRKSVKVNTKAWGGRFHEATHALMERFNASISFDKKLAPFDIAGSFAHAKMLVAQGIISAREGKAIEKGLAQIADELAAEKYTFRIEDEDIHMSVERRLQELIGPTAGKLHSARSRNDQVALDLRLYARAFARRWQKKTELVIAALISLSEQNETTILPGYTHLQRAQPILLAHHLLAYAWMFLRDRDRTADLLKRLDLSPLGAGALAGTPLPIDRAAVARDLGFSGLVENSLDAVSDRDFALEIMGAASIQMVHISRFAEELVLWSSQEFGFVALPEGFSTGSSMMPQKVNPDSAELLRGKSGRVFGNLISLLTALKGLPLAYNKDMQEDKEPFFDTCETLDICLDVLATMLPGLRFNAERMRAATQEGFVLATDLADYLVEKGLPFREAHRVVGELVQYAAKHGKTLEALPLPALQSHCPLFSADVLTILSVDHAVARRKSAGGTAPREVKKQIEKLKAILKKSPSLPLFKRGK